MIHMQKLFVPVVAKNMNVKVFNIMSRTYETRHIKWNETFKYKCRLDGIIVNADSNAKN